MTSFCFGYGRSANRVLQPRRWQSSGSDLVVGLDAGPICGAPAESSQHHLRVAWEKIVWRIFLMIMQAGKALTTDVTLHSVSFSLQITLIVTVVGYRFLLVTEILIRLAIVLAWQLSEIFPRSGGIESGWNARGLGPKIVDLPRWRQSLMAIFPLREWLFCHDFLKIGMVLGVFLMFLDKTKWFVSLEFCLVVAGQECFVLFSSWCFMMFHHHSLCSWCFLSIMIGYDIFI